MRLSDCSAKLRPLQVLNFADCDIEDVTNDSRAVRSGSLFCAIRGAKADGRRFVPAAEAAGAAAIVSDDPELKTSLPHLVCADAYRAWGLLCELFLSTIHCQFPTKEMQQTVRFIRNVYGPFAFTCDDYTHLYDLMRHDKKNVGGEINFTLLGGIGDIRLNQHLTREQVFESFDFFREG